MTNETVGDDARTPNADSDAQDVDQDPGAIWKDPNVPLGDAPPLPKGTLVALGIAWVGWTVFLVAMVVSRMDTPAL